MDPELLRLLLEILRSQNTTGSAAIGGDVPYDDYGVFSGIGGLGAALPKQGVVQSNGIADATGNPASFGTQQSAVGGDHPINLPPPTTWLAGTTPAPGWIDVPIAANLQAKPQPHPVEQHSWPAGPFMWEDWTVRNPFSDQPERPSFQPMPRNIFDQPSTARKANPVAAPTAEPVERFKDALPKAKQRQVKPVEKPRGREAAQQIVSQARATQPQRQYSAPAFVSAPASRVAAQHSLANALNAIRTLSRR